MFSKKFICASHEYSSYKKLIPAPYFRKSFYIYSEPKKVRVTICGLGFYELFINGHRLTKGILAPYISNPDHIIYYDEYDLTNYADDGKNVLGILLGNGMQNAPGGSIWDFDKAPFRGAPRVSFAIEIENTDGTVDVIEADRNVKTASSPVLFDDLRCGCFYDARREIPDWSAPRFVDDLWDDALLAETPRGEPRLTEAEPISPIRNIAPVSVRKCTAAEYHPDDKADFETDSLPTKEREGYLYDFGINSAGIERLRIRGEKGQQVDLQFCEYVDTAGHPNYNNINFYPKGYSQRDIYILKGEGEEIFEPMFTYHGFRYCVVYGITEEQATPDLLTDIICSSALEERGNFRCSDETANKLQAMTRNSTLSNFYYFPTDCPHREKNGWTGDAALSCEHATLNLATEKSYKEWLRSIRKAQKESGELPGIVPTDAWGYEWGCGPAWDAALTYLPYYTYLYRGDTDILKENADSIFRYVTLLSKHRTSRGTVEFGLGDWCPITTVKSPLEFTDSVTVMSILEKASLIFKVLHLPLQKEFTDKLYSEVRAAVREYLVDLNTMTAIGRCQTSQAMALYYGVFEPGEKRQAFRVLLQLIKEANFHMDCGVLGARALFRVLSDFGESALAFDMITRPDFPSYGNFVERGLTALPEDFRTKDDSPASLNHHFFGDISAWFILYLAGIRVNPHRNDPSEVNIAPCFIDKLSNASGFYKTIAGKISSRWEKIDGGIRLTVEKADGVHGKIRLPDGYIFDQSSLSFQELTSGTFFIIKTI